MEWSLRWIVKIQKRLHLSYFKFDTSLLSVSISDVWLAQTMSDLIDNHIINDLIEQLVDRWTNLRRLFRFTLLVWPSVA